MPTRKATPKSRALPLLVVLLLLLVVAGAVYFYQGSDQGTGTSVSNKRSEGFLESIGLRKEEETPPPPTQTQPQVRPLRPLPTGRQTGQVSGKFSGPNITELTVDPVDAEANQTQTIEVKLKDSNPVTAVTATIKLDTKSSTINLSLSSGSNTDGLWIGSGPFPDDSLDKNYTITIEAVSATGTSQTTATFR